jgi:hypothetical protein
MCDFGATAIALSVASAAIGTASALAQNAGQQAMASQQDARNKLQAQYIEQNRQQEQLQAQQQTVYKNDEAYQQLENMTRQHQSAEATAMTSAGDNGVDPGSVSVQALAQDYDARAGQFSDNVRYNREADDNQIALQMQGFNTRAQSEDNQLPPPVYPSFLSTALQIGGSVVNAYGIYQRGQVPSGANNPDVRWNNNPTYPSRTYDPVGGV